MHPKIAVQRRFFAGVLCLLAAVLSLGSCSADGPLATTTPEAGSLEEAGSIADLSGTWSWSDVEQLTMPPFVAEFIFGIEPEGPVTHVRCESAGTLTLFQTGAAFSGAADRTVTCETKGGHEFTPPPMAAAPFFDVQEGSIRGRSLHFLLVGGPIPCPLEGVVSEIQAGVATGLKASGRCIVPGHPQSPVPMDPPPAGTSKIVSWEAERP